jgi:hypothetical protein
MDTNLPERSSVLTPKTICNILRNPQRRIMLSILLDCEKPVALADLARSVTAHEMDTPIPELSGEQSKKTYALLRHKHIPKLVDAGIIDHHSDRNTVELTERGTQLESVLDEM